MQIRTKSNEIEKIDIVNKKDGTVEKINKIQNGSLENIISKPLLTYQE